MPGRLEGIVQEIQARMRAIKVGRKRERVKDVTLLRHRRDLLTCLKAVLALELEQADRQRLRKC